MVFGVEPVDGLGNLLGRLDDLKHYSLTNFHSNSADATHVGSGDL